MVSATEILADVYGRRYISSDPSFLFIDVRSMDIDLSLQTRAIILLEQRINEEREAQKRIHEESRKQIKRLEDKVETLLNVLMGTEKTEKKEEQGSSTQTSNRETEKELSEQIEELDAEKKFGILYQMFKDEKHSTKTREAENKRVVDGKFNNINGRMERVRKDVNKNAEQTEIVMRKKQFSFLW